MEEIYEPLDKSLQHVGALMDAAEAHGILSSFLCVSQSNDKWLQHILGNAAIDGLALECQRQLQLVKNYTLGQLSSFNCEFTPLLPNDDITISKRVQALGGWCEGFLFGLGLTNINIELLPNDIKEFIDDLVSISRIAPTEEDNTNNENDYAELVEYVRVGVMNIYEELTHNGTK
ncbi:UPF0149 family protein [Candidatus Halobeggiatoa sp. HSG11]|nr:UPF0149 family protein [Candidatus Halobeggiatoa sp. HSG11]